MSRYIDAEHIPNDKFFKDLTDVEKAKVLSWFAQAPTAVVVEVVRCKDCKHFLNWQSKSHQGICMCEEKETVYGSEFHPFESDFCSYGERKDEE